MDSAPAAAAPAVTERPATPDYRMIAFSLAGRDYGIDIMKVKEISRESRFTYVPNTAPYVLGVHNLRGEIIPVIDLRRMFNLPVEKVAEGAEHSMLILRLNELVVGVVVDSIDGVRSAPAADIQPPHPIFGDINMQYISGVLERDGKLYVLLDVDRIFRPSPGIPLAAAAASAAAVQQGRQRPAAQKPADQDLRFICEGLASLASFHATPVNLAWVERRLAEWRAVRESAGLPLQLRGAEDAREYLAGFRSPRRDELWGDGEREAFVSLLGVPPGGTFVAWNQGCGRGFGAYSIVCAVKAAHSGHSVKVWANDANLVEIAAAPTLTLPSPRVPRFYLEHGFAKETPAGCQFVPVIRDCVIFEYTESAYREDSPQVDLVLCQDVLSFLAPEAQRALLSAFAEKLKPGGLLILGANEQAEGAEWRAVEKGGLRGHVRETEKE
jgi:purine-binding chemotaxis protein CheW